MGKRELKERGLNFEERGFCSVLVLSTKTTFGVILSMSESIPILKKKSLWQKRESIVLQERDYEIFVWLLDQKFSDLETLKAKFFDPTSESMGGVRTRIQKLEAKGYLRAELLDVGSTKKFYLATAKAHREAEAKFTSVKLPRAIKEISNVTFSHDKFVLLSRMHLEKQGRAFHWKSERRLKAILSASGQNIEREFMPDGIFTNKNGELTAFELENTPKNYEKYQKKIARFVSLMEGSNPAFRFCLYVTTSINTKNVLKKLTAPYSKRFLVQTFDELCETSQTAQKNEVMEAANV